jgi:hypothetical protein
MGNYVQPDYRVPATAPTAAAGFTRNPLGIGAPTTPYQQPGTQNPAANPSVGVQVESGARNPMGLHGPVVAPAQAGTSAPTNAASILLGNPNPLNVTGPQAKYIQPGTQNPSPLPHGQLSDVMGTS